MLEVGINVSGVTTADKLTSQYLYKVRANHVQCATLRLFAFLRNKGVSRDQAQTISNDLGYMLRNKLDVKGLLLSDEIASKVGISRDCRFIFPNESYATLKRCSYGFIQKHPLLGNWFGERRTSECAPMVCPTAMLRGQAYSCN